MLDLFTLNDWLVYLPIIVFSIVFLVGFLIGVIRGRYKVVRRFIYVILFMIVMLFLTPKLIEVGLNITIPILNKSGNQYINEFIASNPDISEIANEIPSLVELIPALISALVSPILYIVLVWVGLIAFFPIYLIYLLVFKLIYKRKKYEVDENGEYIRDGGHRKIKVRYKKHRLTGGLIRGIQSVFVFSIVLMPINAANRMYNVAKSELENESISLCASIEFLNEYQQICDYLDLYNASYLAKAQKINVVDELMFKQLTTMKLNGEKFNLENEVNTFIRAFMKVEKSNIISVLGESEIELETLSTIDLEVIKEILDTLFSSKIFSNLVTEGVNYGVKLATPELRNLLEDQEFVVNLKYDVPSIKKEIRIIINIFKIIADNDLVGYLDGGVEDPLQIKNNISEQTIHNLIDNLLELQLARELMPGLLSKYGASFGVKVPTTTINWDNEKSLYKRVVSLLYLVDDYSSVDLILDNLNDENIQLVAALLDDLDSSSMLEDVLETTIPKLLNTYLGGLTISSEVIASIESWEEELNIIKAGVEIYLSYTNDDTIPLEKISDTLALIKRSDLMMDLMPKALNIALPLIDTSFENIPSGLNWSQEIDYMITIVDNLLTIGEMTEFDIELLNNEDKRESATNIVVAAASSGVFKGFFNNILLEMSGPLLSEIGIELTHDDLNLVSDWRVELDSILSLYNDYIVSDDTGYSFSLDGLDETKVTALFTTFESLTILTNHRVPILVNMIEKANIMNEAELISFRAIDKSSVDYDTEKGILIDLVSNQSLQDTLVSLDLASVDVYALGSLLNKIYGDDSILIREFTTNKLLAQSNLSIVLTEEKIESVIDWIDELNYIQAVANSAIGENFESFDIKFATIEEIQDLASVIENGLASTLLQEAIEDTIIALFDNNGLEVTINPGIDWIDELLLLQEMVNADDSTDIANLFNRIELSPLLGSQKEVILVKVARQVDSSIGEGVTITSEEYEDELGVLIMIVNEKDKIDSLAGLNIVEEDDLVLAELGALIDASLDSILFGNKVESELINMLINNGFNNQAYIDQVESWEIALPEIKGMLQ